MTVGLMVVDSNSPLAGKKIIHVSSWARTFTQFRMPILRRLESAGAEQTIYCPNEPDHAEKLVREGFSVVFGGVSPSFSWRIPVDIIELVRYLHHNKFDCLIAHQPMGALIGITSATYVGLPCKIYSTGGLKFQPAGRNLINFIFKKSELTLIGLSSAVFLVNREDERILRKMGLGKKVYYVGPRGGCGVDLSRFNSKNKIKLRRHAREELGVQDGTVVIGYTGRCVWEKGFFEMIEAAGYLRECCGEDHRFVIVGGEDHRRQMSAILAEARRRGVEDQFIFTGYHFDIERVMAAFDIFILPSYREGLPISLLEAMAMGTPAIATDIRGSRELIDDGKTGILVPVRDGHAISVALQTLIKNEGLRFELAERAARKIAKNYDENALVTKTISYIGMLLEEYNENSALCE